jgi:hypothetical protein
LYDIPGGEEEEDMLMQRTPINCAVGGSFDVILTVKHEM